MSDTTTLRCPHCAQEIGGQAVSRLMDNSRMSFSITPQEGELLTARNVGSAIEQMDRLLTAIGKDMGVKTVVGVECVSFEKGAITINLLLARHELGLKKRPRPSPNEAAS